MDVAARFEFKYVLTAAERAALRARFAPRLLPDAVGAPDGRYPVVSLYCDTPDRRCHWEAWRGVPSRRKLRLRLYGSPDGASPVLLHHFKHNKVLHERVVMLSVQTLHVPEVRPDERLTIKELGEGFIQVIAAYGFMETPNVIDVLKLARGRGLAVDVEGASFYLGRETLLTSGRAGMAHWRKEIGRAHV